MSEGQPYFIILLVLSVALHFIFPVMTIIYAPYTYLGILLICSGLILDLWSSYLFVKSKTTVSPYGAPLSLVTSGPYRISRNPMYLAMAAMLLGIAILSGSLSPFISPIVFVVLVSTLLIPGEEKKLGQIFGKDYEDYKQKVRRWI